jgi:hypothetical protein
MSQGPSLLFDKSTLESLSVNEAVLLDNFYRSTITPLFFVECLADLEREMHRMRGTQEQLVGSLAERTPDCQSAANLHHMEVLKAELSGQFLLDTVLLRPFVPSGKVVELADSKGMLFQPSEEEEAVQRWAQYDFLGLERQIAKRWRKMIEQIDLQAMSRAGKSARDLVQTSTLDSNNPLGAPWSAGAAFQRPPTPELGQREDLAGSQSKLADRWVSTLKMCRGVPQQP